VPFEYFIICGNYVAKHQTVFQQKIGVLFCPKSINYLQKDINWLIIDFVPPRSRWHLENLKNCKYYTYVHYDLMHLQHILPFETTHACTITNDKLKMILCQKLYATFRYF